MKGDIRERGEGSRGKARIRLRRSMVGSEREGWTRETIYGRTGLVSVLGRWREVIRPSRSIAHPTANWPALPRRQSIFPSDPGLCLHKFLFLNLLWLSRRMAWNGRHRKADCDAKAPRLVCRSRGPAQWESKFFLERWGNESGRSRLWVSGGG